MNKSANMAGLEKAALDSTDVNYFLYNAKNFIKRNPYILGGALLGLGGGAYVGDRLSADSDDSEGTWTGRILGGLGGAATGVLGGNLLQSWLNSKLDLYNKRERAEGEGQLQTPEYKAFEEARKALVDAEESGDAKATDAALKAYRQASSRAHDVWLRDREDYKRALDAKLGELW